ncbi:imidazole glycerol phosphate synthase subunit HisH [uncultured Brachyspira sp.]|uniref:imidazole glycerol phosphate synthase subunit HisH n=1 Tax=uncultured Brachyspira sp. TaxID=221953 RepID=UPI002606C57E|nr:imidazole glycerol phosphate synthase subunit HisH [uncultured Brachyspira sp.]
MTAIIDYGVGNLFSLMSSLDYVGIDTKLTDDEKIIKNADAIILPGVGAFRDAITKLEKINNGILKNTIIEEAKKGKLILGICLGMQMFFDKSYEYGEYNGLGLIKGNICPIVKDLKNKDLKVPHMGWNNINIKKEDKIFKYINNMEYVYFVHSYYGKDCEESIIADSEYEINIPAVVKNDNVYGIQFHPEKSGSTGLNILKGFKDLI